MNNHISESINKLIDLFCDNEKEIKIKNICFNEEKIIKLEKEVEELKEELKNMKFICHEKEDSHLLAFRSNLDKCYKVVKGLNKKLGIKDS